MLRIGICDDSAEARQHMLQLCQKYYENNTDAFEYKMYKNAEEVLEYCDDEEIGKAPEDDSDFDNEFNVDYEYEEEPSTADNYYYRGPQKKQKTISDIIENKKVVLIQKQRSTSLSFQNNYSVVHDIISKSLLASLSLLEEPNKLFANANDDSDKEEKIS